MIINFLKLYLFINYIFLFVNLIFLKYEYHHFFFNSINKYYLKLSIKSFNEISNYLNLKYNSKNILNFLNNNNKKIINLYFTNFQNKSFYRNEINKILLILKKNYTINITKNNPDYIIYDVFGCNHIRDKYKNAIKIAYLTENVLPDFNIADYAIGHAHLNYLDRYFKNPIYYLNKLLLIKINNIEILRNKILKSSIRKKFAAAVISNNRTGNFFRLKFIKELNKYKKIDLGGRYKNNVGKIYNKIKFLSSYKFSIAMENSEGDGYLSEKILDSFQSGTIPIYYGDYMVEEYINPKAYILIRGKIDMKKKIEYIKKIDNNDELYKKILKEKLLINNYNKNEIDNKYNDFFYNIFKQNKNMAKRVDKK